MSIQVELQGRHDLKRFENSGQFALGAEILPLQFVLVLPVVVEVAVAVGKIRSEKKLEKS